MKIKRLIIMGFWVSMLAGGMIFHAALYNYLWGVAWNKVLSMGVFVIGSVYAIIERNFIIGLVAIAAALLMPWIQNWLTAYWPWFKANYGLFTFH